MASVTASEKDRLLRGVEAAVRGEDIARAIGLAREALELGVEEPLVLNLRAYWHEQEGRNIEALTDLEQAHRLAPHDVPVLNALGLAYARLGRMSEAAQTFDSAIRQDPNFGPAHFNKGWSSEDLGELDMAKQCYERVIALTPTSADAWARLAALAARLGDWNAASTSAARALSIQPRHPLASVTLARTELSRGEFPGAELRLGALLGESALPPDDRARTEGCLADVLDAQGRSNEAFAAYSRRNDLLRRVHHARFAAPGVETMPQYLERLSATFSRSTPGSWKVPTPIMTDEAAPRGHAFILGFARSGTTMLEEVLATNASVSTTQERDALSDSVREYLTTPDGLARLDAASPAVLAVWRKLYWRRIGEFDIECKDRFLIDKQPFNTFKLPLISKLFPTAKILFSIRDPRDVVLSCFRREFRMNSSTFEFLTIEGAARLYDSIMRTSETFRAGLRLSVLQVRHEDLVADFSGQMQSVCEFIGLSFNAAMQDFAAPSGRRAVATPSSAQIRRGLNNTGIGQWRRYRSQLAPVLPILAPWIERFGYPIE